MNVLYILGRAKIGVNTAYTWLRDLIDIVQLATRQFVRISPSEPVRAMFPILNMDQLKSLVSTRSLCWRRLPGWIKRPWSEDITEGFYGPGGSGSSRCRSFVAAQAAQVVVVKTAAVERGGLVAIAEALDVSN